ILPVFKGNLRQFWLALRDYEEMEERRTCYVALTRAKHHLVVTGSHWYGEGQRPKEPSMFFEELAQWGEESGLALVERGPDVPEGNPLIGYRGRFVRDWPGPALRDEADSFFRGGWRMAAAEAERDPRMLEELVSSLDEGERDRYRSASGELATVAAHLADRESAGPSEPSVPITISVGGVIEYARCPKRFYWSAVRPLPRFSGPAARMGTQVHAWIERRSSGQASLLELDDVPDLTSEELAGAPGKLERLQRAFSDSRFASGPPLFAERPFLLYLGGFVVSGRIDAIFGTPEGPWEIVDYKTGRKPPEDDPMAGLQLDLYALACTEIWGKRSEDLTLTYFYLAGGDEVSRPAGDTEETRARAISSLQGIAAREFRPIPSEQCHWCDFLSFCDAGKRYVEAAASD
ncbi:MAG: PD-(D/E)XK nuclease family protein, partial [Actinomycetota bacterium]